MKGTFMNVMDLCIDRSQTASHDTRDGKGGCAFCHNFCPQYPRIVVVVLLAAKVEIYWPNEWRFCKLSCSTLAFGGSNFSLWPN
jgi:hypothetical protein